MAHIVMFSFEQQTYLDKSPYPLSTRDYVNSHYFSNMFQALQASNSKCTQLLERLVEQKPAGSDSIKNTITNLNESLSWAQDRLDSIKREELTQVPSYTERVSLELVTTGLSPEREDKTETDQDNIRAFEEEMIKAAKFQAAFKEISTVSRWPKYRDVQVVRSFGADYNITKKPVYARVERVVLVLFLIAAAFFMQLFVRSKILPLLRSI